MDINLLKQTAQAMVVGKKGILAADESTKTIQKRLEKIGLESNPQINLAYRQMLFTTPGIEEYISGVILFDETIRQEIDGKSMSEYLSSRGILPGIKVDKGAVDMEGHPGEKITEGLEGLDGRMKEYEKKGAKFAKWRAVITIGQGIPTDDCIAENAKRLAEYAYICQQNNIVPIVEPEVLMDADNTLEVCREVTSRTLKAVFEKLKEKGVVLEGIILKPNMVISGKNCPVQASGEEVAQVTVETLKDTVPAEVPGIVFLSGGQSPDQATENLALINQIPGSPWKLSFSYGRALQDEALTVWSGKEENVEAAQKAFIERAKKVSSPRAS
ncbi:fructose-bisphosphate aldolase [Candidatus Daviesbacteria bacterium RIFCSPHIGHO2_02_FULL_36_13]|uniref:Fructose-bisphosphate aldolase n=1 Tax=Candidatus Daviesbacteria bacterium RIFCSPHIGHO2_02_FULL_36_13 TaxID=1797768 RepID=A0A1F5JVD8_9BACT|nr:MAG: fructose-bisphosphate aldolase [Candidatus Daviesbacteria bacterium RIFCSPHIGHO2_02_FULL_36_13]